MARAERSFGQMLDTVRPVAESFVGRYAISQDGRSVLRQVEGGMGLFRLDPALWKRHLCDVLGRDLSEDERRGLPSQPLSVCPQRP